MKYLFAFGLLLAHATVAPPAVAQLRATSEVRAPAGTVVGVATPTGRQFLGIPYAVAPVGALRWAAPQARPTASARIVAQAFGPRCVQPVDQWVFNAVPGTAMQGSEDCLTLNVYTPLSAPRTATPKNPVMVWIHGGGFVTGAGSDYDGHVLAERQDVVVVTLNYRLGALGFLSHPALGAESGDFGLLDQQMALRWVRRNIAAFGGDPANVTIFGESAGGVSVCAQLRSPTAKGLFARAIIQSGPCVAAPRSFADQRGVRFAAAAGCPATELEALRCLRAIPPFTVAANSPGATGIGDTPWAPVEGNAVVPQSVSYGAGNFHRVPVLNGWNRDEGRRFALAGLAGLRNDQDYRKNLDVQFGAKAAGVLTEYPMSRYGSPTLAYAAHMTDWLFACPALAANDAMARHTPVYAYEFGDQRAPFAGTLPSELPTLGAYHTAEIQYVFQTPSPMGGPATFTAEQARLADQMQQAWASFARGGVPVIAGEATWQPVRPGQPWVKRLDTQGTSTVEDFAAAHRCGFWSTP